MSVFKISIAWLCAATTVNSTCLCTTTKVNSLNRSLNVAATTKPNVDQFSTEKPLYLCSSYRNGKNFFEKFPHVHEKCDVIRLFQCGCYLALIVRHIQSDLRLISSPWKFAGRDITWFHYLAFIILVIKY